MSTTGLKRVARATHRLTGRERSQSVAGATSCLPGQQTASNATCAGLNNVKSFRRVNTPLSREAPEDYKVNRAHALAHLKPCLPRWLVRRVPTGEEIATVFAELVRKLIPYVQGASKPRPLHPEPQWKHAYKSTC